MTQFHTKGISTSAGIPDFRSPETGLYSNLSKYNLPYPEAVFDISYFRNTPNPFFVLAKELYPGLFRPTKCHYFIRLVAKENLLLRHYTQNIDTLERVAGIPDGLLVEAHGSFATASCVGRFGEENEDDSDNDDKPINNEHVEESSQPPHAYIEPCGKAYTQEWVKEKIMSNTIPECVECGGIVKPDITFFGEALPARFHSLYPTDFREADALIVIGTYCCTNFRSFHFHQIVPL